MAKFKKPSKPSEEVLEDEDFGIEEDEVEEEVEDLPAILSGEDDAEIVIPAIPDEPSQFDDDFQVEAESLPASMQPRNAEHVSKTQPVLVPTNLAATAPTNEGNKVVLIRVLNDTGSTRGPCVGNWSWQENYPNTKFKAGITANVPLSVALRLVETGCALIVSRS